MNNPPKTMTSITYQPYQPDTSAKPASEAFSNYITNDIGIEEVGDAEIARLTSYNPSVVFLDDQLVSEGDTVSQNPSEEPYEA